MLDHAPGAGAGLASPRPGTRSKLRTSSCSTEESSSGVESLSTASSLASASCCALAAPSSPDSETSDYRASPRPAPRPSTRLCTRANTGGSASTRGGTRPRRRATVPPCRVSLAKLSLPAELSPCPLTATPTATPTSKKIKLEAEVEEADDRLHPSQDSKPGLDTKCNVSVLPPAPSILAHGCQVKTEAGASLLARLKAEPALSSSAVKLELAQLDSQLAAGKLLLDSASHQLRDMLLMDKINSRLYSKIIDNIGPGYTVKHEAEDAKTAIDDKVEITKNNHNNNNVNEKKPREKSASTEYSDEEYVTCKWKGCDNRMEVQHLLEHLMSVHTLPQKAVSGSGRYQCLWGGCKVHGQAATSFTWLQTHVTKHVGTKPFLCIVAGCRMRFGSQVTLSRHVNSHFKNPAGGGTAGGPSGQQPGQGKQRPAPASPVKFYVRKTRRRQLGGRDTASLGTPAGPDLFHVGIMAGIRGGLARLPAVSSGGQVEVSGEVKSRKLDEDGNIHYLVSWSPPGVFADEWVTKANLRVRRSVALSQLPQPLKTQVENHVFGSPCHSKVSRKPLKFSGPPKLT